jgi:hypothetical protein
MSALIHFPSESAIVTYLEQSIRLNKKAQATPNEEKMIQAVAAFFADQERDLKTLDEELMKKMIAFNEKLEIPRLLLLILKNDIFIAFQNRAQGKSLDASQNKGAANLQAKL